MSPSETEEIKPFDGIRVIDMTHVLAGPFSTHQLAMLGADVIKVEGPDAPDMTREEGATPVLNAQGYGTYFLAQNSGKRAIAVDIKSDAGRAAIEALIKTADVLVENYTTGTLDGLGLGYAAMKAVNPRLIYCSLTGFGQTGPKAGDPAYDVVIQAFTGLMDSNGEENSPPVRVGAPMVDYGAGAQAALAISAALFQRERTGRGQRIDVAMADAALMLQGVMVTATLASGSPPKSHGNTHPKYAGYATFDTADGRIMIGGWTNRQMARLYRVLGDEVRAVRTESTPRGEVGTLREEDGGFIRECLMAKSADAWETILNDHHVPASRVRTVDETMASAQIASRRVLQSYHGNDVEGAPPRLPVAAFLYEHGGPEIKRAPPRHGQHTTEILSELGYSDQAINDMRNRGDVL